ncbi:MAG: GAF domain-containing protein [Chloroflexota bacterium]
MNRLTTWLFDTSPYVTRMDRYRATLVYVITVMILIPYAVYAVTVPEWTLPDGRADQTMLDVALRAPLEPAGIAFYVTLLLSAVTIAATRRGLLHEVRWFPVVTWYISGVLLTALTGDTVAYGGLTIVLLIFIAGLLTNIRGIFAAAVIGSVSIVLRGIGDPAFFGTGGVTVYSVLILIAGTTILVYLFLRLNRVAEQQTVFNAVEDRSITAVVLRQIAAQVAQRVTPRDLLARIVDQIAASFDSINHVQIYLMAEDGLQAELVASTEPGGKQRIAEGYTIPLGTNSVISRVMETGGSMIEGPEATPRPGERLPGTAIHVVLPLRIGPKILGALDLQSERAAAFDNPNAIATFQALGDSLALAVDNVSQFERAETRLRENERLVGEARAALAEVERLNERLTGTAWAGYLQGAQRHLAAAVDFKMNTAPDPETWTDTLLNAMQSDQFIQSQQGDSQIVAIPLRVRGRVVGAMEFEMDSQRPFTPEDYDLVQEVSERFGLAVENARLVEESQQLAQREALVNQITTRLQGTNDIENMLSEAARGLVNALRANRVSIRLGAHEQTNGDQRR